jgi:hypothetical protein
MGTAAIDSRDYIVAFEVHSIDDCPPDFELSSALRGFNAGVFLPRDDPDWFGRSTYPPRIVLLEGGRLRVITHPSAREPDWECRLSELVWVESGQMLLKGWLRFCVAASNRAIRYNTRGYRSVSRFMRRLRRVWIGDENVPSGAARLTSALPGLDLKFGHALARELDPGEVVAAHFFQPARESDQRRWFLRRRRWTPSDLFALTARRLLWITDRDRGAYSRYGTIASFAPAGNVAGMNLMPAVAGRVFEVRLRDGSHWTVPVGVECRQLAEKFAAEATGNANHAIGCVQLRS